MSLEKVGERALSVVVQDFDYKPVEKKPKKVLDEEKYTEDLEKIIVRDFYPDLPKLKVQQEYLSAVDRNDTETIRRIHHKYGPKGRPGTSRPATTMSTLSSFETPGGPKATPSTFETPLEESNKTPHPAGSKDGPAHNPEPHEAPVKKSDADLPLDKYLNKNTSEDNASFKEILEEGEKKRRLKHGWLYEKEGEQKEEQGKYLALPSAEEQQQLALKDKRTKLDSWTYIPKNNLMYIPEGSTLSASEKIELEGKKPKEIVHNNTRFAGNPFDQASAEAAKNQAATNKAIMKSGKIGVDGKELLPTEAPTVNGFNFVATPSPAPGVDESPLMTWGEIEGTPFRLDASDTPLPAGRTPATGPTFKIPLPPRREQLAHQLAEKASKAHRDKKEKALKRAQANFASPSPGFGLSGRLNSMSPAAQLLAASAKRQSTDSSLRASYSPSPGASMRKTSLTPSYTPKSSPSPRHKEFSSPALGSSGSSVRREQAGLGGKRLDLSASLTDNLLNLPKRQKATDFF